MMSIINVFRLVLTQVLIILLFSFQTAVGSQEADSDERIQPYIENPMYWQYKGKPLLLIGGSDTDNAFQLTYKEEHPDDLQALFILPMEVR